MRVIDDTPVYQDYTVPPPTPTPTPSSSRVSPQKRLAEFDALDFSDLSTPVKKPIVKLTRRGAAGGSK